MYALLTIQKGQILNAFLGVNSSQVVLCVFIQLVYHKRLTAGVAETFILHVVSPVCRLQRLY